MLFFCPLDNPAAPSPAVLAEQRALILAGDRNGERDRPGLVVDAPSPCAATATLEAYLLDCHRSGRPGYVPTVEIEDREGVPVAKLIDNAPRRSATETAAITAMTDNAARRKAARDKPADAGGARPVKSETVIHDAGGMPPGMGGMPPKKNAESDHFAIDEDNRSAPL